MLGAEQLPRIGATIVAANHVGALDGPLMAIFAPRPTHALTKSELFRGPLGPVLRGVGQIQIDRFHTDPRAVKSALRVLRDGHVVGIFPEGTRGVGDFSGVFHRGAAYLAMATGAPVVPLTFVGSGPTSGSGRSVPPRGAKITMVFGEPWRTAHTAWPRRREQVTTQTELLQRHLYAARERALDPLYFRAPRSTP